MLSRAKLKYRKHRSNECIGRHLLAGWRRKENEKHTSNVPGVFMAFLFINWYSLSLRHESHASCWNHQPERSQGISRDINVDSLASLITSTKVVGSSGPNHIAGSEICDPQTGTLRMKLIRLSGGLFCWFCCSDVPTSKYPYELRIARASAGDNGVMGNENKCRCAAK